MVSKVLVTAVLVALAAHLFSPNLLISVKQSGLYTAIVDGGWGTLGAGFVVAVLLHRNLWGYTPSYDDSKERKRTLKRRAAQYPAPYPNGDSHTNCVTTPHHRRTPHHTAAVHHTTPHHITPRYDQHTHKITPTTT